jgi:hypothetical protein
LGTRTGDECRRLIAEPPKDPSGLPLNEINSVRVDEWIAAQCATGKRTRASSPYSLLSTIMSHAVARRICLSEYPRSMCGGQSAHTVPKAVPLSDDELTTIINPIASRYQAIVRLADEAGLHYGDASELHVSDITVERVLVSVTPA